YGLSGFTFGELESTIGDVHDYTPAQLAQVLDRIKDIPDAATLADRDPTRLGEPIEFGPDAALPDTYLSEDSLKTLLEGMGVEGNVLSYSPGWIEENQATNIVVLCEKDGDSFQISLGIDSQKKIKAATRLDLDLNKKTDAAGVRVLESLAEGNDALTAANARAPFQAARQAGKPVGEALAEALRAVRDRVPPGSGPDTYAFHELERSGMITPGDATAVRQATEQFFGVTYVEQTIFHWIDAAGPAAGVDVSAVKGAYARALQQAGGGAEGRAAALEAALRLLPDDMGFAGEGSVVALLQAPGQAMFVPEANVEAFAALLRQKVSGDTPGLIGAMLRGHLLGVSELASTGSTEPVDRAVEAVTQALQGGGDVAVALPQALQAFAYETEGALSAWETEMLGTSTTALAGLPEATASALEAGLAKVAKETEAAGQLVWAIRGDEAPGTDTTWAQVRDAVGRHGGEFLPAAIEVIRARGCEDPRQLSQLARSFGGDAAAQERAHAQLLDAAGVTPVDLVRSDVVEALKEGREYYGLSAADERDALSTFDRTVAAGTPVGDALIAVAASVVGDASGEEAVEAAAMFLGNVDVPPSQAGQLLQLQAGLEALRELSWMTSSGELDSDGLKGLLRAVVDGKPVGEAVAGVIGGFRIEEDNYVYAMVDTLIDLRQMFPAHGAELLAAGLQACNKTEAELFGASLAGLLENEHDGFVEPARQAFDARMAAGGSIQEATFAAMEAAAAAVPADEATLIQAGPALRSLARFGGLDGGALQAKLVELSPLTPEAVAEGLADFASMAGEPTAIVDAVQAAVAAAGTDPAAQLAALASTVAAENFDAEGQYVIGLDGLEFLLQRIPADQRAAAVDELLTAMGATRGAAVMAAASAFEYEVAEDLRTRLAAGEPLETALPAAATGHGVPSDGPFVETLLLRGLLDPTTFTPW
ncbi:MAG: hypothetical protein ACYS22_04495, partial [Planctomycetota bacterium]